MRNSVLIADDEVHIRLLIEQSLEDLEDDDVTIKSVSNGEDALEYIQAEKPKLVILDVMMPIMDGFEVCKTVKDDPKLASTYIILLTAKGQKYDRQRGVEVGADDYMTKPFDSDQLLSRAREILEISG